MSIAAGLGQFAEKVSLRAVGLLDFKRWRNSCREQAHDGCQGIDNGCPGSLVTSYLGSSSVAHRWKLMLSGDSVHTAA
jgi:hypothetical protein